MRKSFIVVGLCLLTVGMPIGLSDCECILPDDVRDVQQSEQPCLSDADITALQKQRFKEGWTFTVGKNPATERPLSQLCGVVKPKNWWVDASFDPCNSTGELPPRFDWRELGGCTPVKNQDGCGACWAFATIAPLECNILIKDQKIVDLSEQWLVSCNRDGWGCEGGWYVYSYFQYKYDKFNGTGAVLEQEFPYVGTDCSCNGPYHHPYTIDSWHYVGYSPQVKPKTDAIKQAIMTYGPVSVCCAITGPFMAYTGGIFNEDNPNAITNHVVTLVGWDDNQGTNGVWFLRNSWGTEWGEEGYMRIEYGVCKVGEAASYVIYPARTNVEITGGLFGVSVGFQNVWNTTTTDIKWNILCKGGIFRELNINEQGTIDSLEPGTSVYKKIPCLGFGPISISVIAIPKNAGKLTKHAEGFLWGSLVIIPQNQ